MPDVQRDCREPPRCRSRTADGQQGEQEGPLANAAGAWLRFTEGRLQMTLSSCFGYSGGDFAHFCSTRCYFLFVGGDGHEADTLSTKSCQQKNTTMEKR